MKILNLFAGIALALSGLFASQTFAASGCITSACDPAAAEAACNPTPAPTPAEDCDPGSISALFAAKTDCDSGSISALFAGKTAGNSAAVNQCNSGCLSADPCGTGNVCNRCGALLCNGLCSNQDCADNAFGTLHKSNCNDICISGYINAGYNSNIVDDKSNGMVDCWSNAAPAFNAIYISAVKKAHTGGCGIDTGFGVDFMFGEDARIFRSARYLDHNWVTGHMYNPNNGKYSIPSYGFAMPQLFMEFAINNWSVKAGHFYGLLGYEGAAAPSRFFYSKGLCCAATPVSQSGILVSYNGFQNLDLTLGWVNGWNNGFNNERFNEKIITGSFVFHINQTLYMKYAFLEGSADMASVFSFWGPFNWGHTKGEGTAHSGVIDLQISRRLEVVTTLHYVDFGQASYKKNGTRALILGEHLYYSFCRCLKVGFRAEWMKNTDYIGGSSQDTEMTSYAFGLNWHPFGNQNLFIRPEFRYDRVMGVWHTQPLNKRDYQTTIGFDVMLTF